MSLLLKSLLAVTRVTPAYKLSRRQGADSYLICYRIYSGEPQLHLLGTCQLFTSHLISFPGLAQVFDISMAFKFKKTVVKFFWAAKCSVLVQSILFKYLLKL